MIKEISTFIFSQVGNPYWVRDETFFVGHLPIANIEGVKIDKIKRVCQVLENAPADVIGDLPDRQDKPIQILNRNESYFTARDDAVQIYETLHGSSQWKLPVLASGKDYTAMIIDAIQAPSPLYNPDDKGWFWFTCNYIFRVCNP